MSAFQFRLSRGGNAYVAEVYGAEALQAAIRAAIADEDAYLERRAVSAEGCAPLHDDAPDRDTAQYEDEA